MKKDCLLLCEAPQLDVFSTCPGAKSVINHVRNLGLTLRIWTWVHPTHARVAPHSFLAWTWVGHASAPQPVWSEPVLQSFLDHPFSASAACLQPCWLPSPQVPDSLSLITIFLRPGESLHILYILGFLLKCHFLSKMPRIPHWYRLSATNKLKLIFSPNLRKFF